MTATESRVRNGEVTLPITCTGTGKKLIFFNGAGSTQVIWKSVIGQLNGQYEIVTFDFRSHGKASMSANHTFKAFLSDADRVMAAVGTGKPIVVAWSFGADLAVAYAAAHPGVLGGLVIIDGALPISKSFVEDEAKMRRSLNTFSMKFSMLLMQFTSYRYNLSGNAIADIVVELDHRRRQMIDEYAKIDCPITMLLATKTSTSGNNNKTWREAGDRLSAAYPSIQMRWQDAGHRLPLTHAVDLAQVIDDFARRVR